MYSRPLCEDRPSALKSENVIHNMCQEVCHSRISAGAQDELGLGSYSLRVPLGDIQGTQLQSLSSPTSGSRTWCAAASGRSRTGPLQKETNMRLKGFSSLTFLFLGTDA